MEDCAELFREMTGVELSERNADYRSTEEIDETISVLVSRLFLENRLGFYFLKERFEKSIKKNKSRLFLSALGYFYYVDCDFKNAIRCFQELITLQPAALGSWFSLAFCYRQSGEESKFNAIMVHYESIIDEFRKTKRPIDALILKYLPAV